jgi:hypothetical protein
VALTELPVLEPYVANSPDAPCATDSNNMLTPTTSGPLAVNAVNVNTEQKPITLGSSNLANGDHASATSTVTNPTVTLGGLVVHADVLTAAVAYTCSKGQSVASSSGQVVGLTVNGQTTTVPQGTNQTISLGALGSLVLNQVDTSQPGRITRRAVSLTTPLGTVVISEATADISGNPCAVSPPPAPPKKPVPGNAQLIPLPPAQARAIAAGRCVRGSFIGRVTGRRIARVAFSLDGRFLGTAVRRPFQTHVPITAGGHRLQARVTFLAASKTAPRTLGLDFTGCTPPSAAFTG